MTSSWQLILLWGVFVGLGTGSMALAFVATVVDRWFVEKRGLVTGILTAGGAAGQLVFLPVLAKIAETYDWKSVAFTVSFAALAVVPFVLLFLRNYPSDVGTTPYGAPADYAPPAKPVYQRGGAGGRAISVLVMASKTKVFWLLAGTFAICGASTNGPDRHALRPGVARPRNADHDGRVPVGVDRNPRHGRHHRFGLVHRPHGLAKTSRHLLPVPRNLAALPAAAAREHCESTDDRGLSSSTGSTGWRRFPPTVALCRQHFGADAPIVFGWVLASHQIGAGLVAFLAGLVRDQIGSYDAAFLVAGALCAIARSHVVVDRKTSERGSIG